MSKPTTRIAAAMLFGGTLGLVSAADAGLTVTSAFVNLQAGAAYASSYDVSVAATGISATGANSALTLSSFTSNGFWLNASSDGSEIWSVFGATYGITADSNTTVRLTGNIDSSSATVFLVDVATNTALFIRGSGSGAWDSGEIQLVAGGSYLVGVNGPLTFANGGTETGTVINFAVVPAPGAAALIGLAGLVSRRRRA